MPTSLPHEVALGALAALFVGGVGWWASYVTQGAGMARKLAAELKALAGQFDEMKDHLTTHEETEEHKFEEVRDEITSLRGDVARVGQDVSAVHGELKGLVTILVQNGVGRR